MAALRSDLKQHRRDAGLSQEALAHMAAISRQAYAALEAGRATPSTEVALRLARALSTSVESLFALAEQPAAAVRAELIGGSSDSESGGVSSVARRVRLSRVGHRLLARPLSGPVASRHALVEADGVMTSSPGVDNQVAVVPLDVSGLEMPNLSLLGCDPAAALLEPELRRRGVRLVWAEEGSHQALAGLARGEAHVAGCHLRDDDTGAYNLSWVRRLVPFPCTLVTFAAWRQGLMVAAGNPKGLRGVQDLALPHVGIVNRQEGSGSRLLLDRLLRRHGIPAAAVAGYYTQAPGHLGVAQAVAAGLADAGVGIQAAAFVMGLSFVPLEEERYDLVIPNHLLNEVGVQALLDSLRHPGLRQRVEMLEGYDVSDMGRPVSVA